MHRSPRHHLPQRSSHLRNVAGARHPRRRGAFTLVELMLASAVALLAMAAVASLFGVFGRTASTTQSIVDMTGRMRSAAARLKQDLDGVTVPLTPPINPERGLGYFELIEGPWTDTKALGTSLLTGISQWGIQADIDDALLFTTRSSAGPFEGRYGTRQIESPVAEVAWFCRPSISQPIPGMTFYTLYRRQMLVASYVGDAPFSTNLNNTITGTINANLTGYNLAIYNTYDLSLRNDDHDANPSTPTVLVPNSLADLTRRENRFAHGNWDPAIPGPHFPTQNMWPAAGANSIPFDAASGREGEDVVLTNVLGFDVLVFDQGARVMTSAGSGIFTGTHAVYSHEQNYSATATSGTFTGSLFDLGKSGTATVLTRAPLAAARVGTLPIYDTWSTHLESNGIDDDADGTIDEATNGLDENANGIPDDPGEAEVPPPYPVPLRTIEVRIRCYDPVSKEIRQTTVRQQFAN